MMTSIKGPTHRRDDEFDLIMYVECGNLKTRSGNVKGELLGEKGRWSSVNYSGDVFVWVN